MNNVIINNIKYSFTDKLELIHWIKEPCNKELVLQFIDDRPSQNYTQKSEWVQKLIPYQALKIGLWMGDFNIPWYLSGTYFIAQFWRTDKELIVFNNSTLFKQEKNHSFPLSKCDLLIEENLEPLPHTGLETEAQKVMNVIVDFYTNNTERIGRSNNNKTKLLESINESIKTQLSDRYPNLNLIIDEKYFTNIDLYFN